MEWVVRENQNGSSELYHYGVKGMRWGVRKERETSGNRNSAYSIKDQSIRTEVGIAKIDGFDAKEKQSDKWILDTIAESIPDRYAKAEVAQKAFDSLPRESMAYTRGYDQASLANHDAPSYMRTINCFECSMAYEMRKRGYNVQAKEMNGGFGVEAQHAFNIKDGFRLQIDLDRAYSGDKRSAAKEAYNRIAQQCLSYGEGARGCLGVQWADYDSGHSMYWIIENGEFKIIDAQDSRRDGDESFLDADVVDKEVTVYRLDNAEVLPGVTDFVEAYSPVTDEEKAVKDKPRQPNMAEAKAKKEADEKRNKNRKEREEAQRKAMKEIEANRSTVEKLIRKVKTATNDLIAKGKRFLNNPLNIQKKEMTITRTVTWEVVNK